MRRGEMVGDAAGGGCRPHLYDGIVLATTRDTCCPTRGRLQACTKRRRIRIRAYGRAYDLTGPVRASQGSSTAIRGGNKDDRAPRYEPFLVHPGRQCVFPPRVQPRGSTGAETHLKSTHVATPAVEGKINADDLILAFKKSVSLKDSTAEAAPAAASVEDSCSCAMYRR